MLKDISGIKIQGRCFEQETELKFFQKEKSRIALVYGRNGSGKSTIAEALTQIKDKAMSDSNLAVSFINHERHLAADVENFNLFVFDEKYIEKNIKLAEDGLQTILLVGEQVDLQGEIDEKKLQEEELRKEFNKTREDLEKREKENGDLNPTTYYQNMGDKLREDKGWAQIDAELKGNKSNSRVSESVIQEIGRLNVTRARNELYTEFLTQKALYEKANTVTATEYPDKIEPVNFNEETEAEILRLLGCKIEKPELTSREKLIVAAIDQGLGNLVNFARDTFQKDDVRYCPYCYQPVDTEYKKFLLESIDKVLNVEVQKHQEYLDAAVKNLFPSFIDFSKYMSLDEIITGKICIKQKECGDIAETYKSLLQQKRENCYVPLETDSKNLTQKISELNLLLAELENKRIDFNHALQTRKTLKEKLLLMNKQLAYFDIKENYSKYINLKCEKQSLETKCIELKGKLAAAKKAIEELKSRSANENLAVDRINAALDYVFFSKGRFSVEKNNQKYYLKSNGIDVSPKNVSIGERNIIALCYFFTQMMTNNKVEQFYSLENFIIIDDPVSSFDFENKVGIITYLRYQAKRIILGNENSKLLVFSHDLQTIFDLCKAGKEICEKFKTADWDWFELCNKILHKKEKSKGKNEYNQLLKRIYHFANGEQSEDSFVIGNIMRRVLEAFATFSYRDSIENVSINSKVLEILGEHSEYFENLMYRLVLHGESHYEERIYNGYDNYNFTDFISDDEKIKTAQNILCFIYFLNKAHLEMHFKEETDALLIIKGWADVIPLNKELNSIAG